GGRRPVYLPRCKRVGNFASDTGTPRGISTGLWPNMLVAGIRCASYPIWIDHVRQIRAEGSLMLEHFDKAFENRVRLQIMAVLMANERYDFNALKELLGVTDG